jgi:pimeloyl-ACP methyl ester carboxylesterase
VRAGDRLHLADKTPVLLVWGADDPIIPAEHARAAHELLPHATLAIFDGVRHFPHLEAPERFIATLQDFCTSTPPARFDAQTWRARLRLPDIPEEA